MKHVAYVLLIGVFIRHDTSLWLADLTGKKASLIFYALGGLWEAMLASVIWLLIADRKAAAYKHLAVLGCIFAISEGLQMSVCRVLAEPGKGNLCDSLTGLPVGATLTSLYTFNVCYFSGLDMTKLPMLLVPLIASAEVAYLVSPMVGLIVFASCYALWSLHGRKS